MTFAEKLQKLRKQNGLSQEQLGEQIGVTRQTISNWELNETTPNPEQLKALSKVLSVSLDELLDNEVEGVLMKKVSNTEQLAGTINKGLRILGKGFLIYIVLVIVALIGLAIYALVK